MSKKKIKNKLKNCKQKILKTFNQIYKKKIKLDNTDLTELLDSLQMFSFISLLEKEFKIKFIDSEISQKNFSNINNLEKILNKKIK